MRRTSGKSREKEAAAASPPAAPAPRPVAEELEAILTISRALAGELDTDRVLNVAMNTVAEIIGAEGSSILLLEGETGTMSFHLAAGPGAEAAWKVPVPPGAGVCGHVIRTGEPLVINDARNDPRLYRKVDQASGVTTSNILCVPLRSGKRLWGVLELINKRGGRDFDDRDVRLATAVGGQIAVALENSHLHRRIVHQERLAAVGRTVSGLAHGVKNVLNGIRSGSAVVDRSLRANDFEKVRQGWSVVRRNNGMLGDLVLDMLSPARESRFNPFPTDVADLTRQICELLAERARERGASIAFEPAEGPGEVMVDPTQLYRCLLNLASNAVEACGESQNVRARVYRARGRERFTVSIADSGAGIRPEHRGKLFTEFFTTKGSKGTGLGLPVTKKLIDGMGGTIKFHSVEGRGTKFVVALPLEAAPSGQATVKGDI